MTLESLSHSRWDCKYHLVFVLKFRKKVLYGKIRAYLGSVFHELGQQKHCKIIEGHTVEDHVHLLLKIPPKYAVSEIVSYIKVKSAIAVACHASSHHATTSLMSIDHLIEGLWQPPAQPSKTEVFLIFIPSSLFLTQQSCYCRDYFTKNLFQFCLNCTKTKGFFIHRELLLPKGSCS